MSETMRAKLLDMACPAIRAGVTQVVIDDLLAGWERVFKALGILGDAEAEMAEFDGIMRARVYSGSISIAPPRLDMSHD